MEKYSLSVKTVVNGDEYYSPQNVVDMIVPYVQKTEYKKYGVRSTQRKADL